MSGAPGYLSNAKSPVGCCVFYIMFSGLIASCLKNTHLKYTKYTKIFRMNCSFYIYIYKIKVTVKK